MVIKIFRKVGEVAGNLRELHRAQRRHGSSAHYMQKVERVRSAATQNRRAVHE